MNPQLPPPIPVPAPPIVTKAPPPVPSIDFRSIAGAQGKSIADLQQAVAAGGRFVVFQYCISVLVLSFKRSSAIMFVPAGESTFVKGLPYSVISLVAGWWGIPWGPIWTVTTIAQNLGGGRDVTAPILAALGCANIPPGATPPPVPLSPTEAAARAERESRKKLVRGLAFVAVALIIGLGFYLVYRSASAAARQPGAAEFRDASNLVGPIGAPGSGNSEKATKMASDMSKLMKDFREQAYSHAAKKSIMDAADEFRTYCYLQEGQCVFLIHVPELRRFKPEAKQSLAESAWFFAQGLLGKRGERMRLAVALRGLTSYDRVLTGEFAPGNGAKFRLKPETFDGVNCEKQLISWFAPQAETTTQPKESVGEIREDSGGKSQAPKPKSQ
jgi:hypothetical protein